MSGLENNCFFHIQSTYHVEKVRIQFYKGVISLSLRPLLNDDLVKGHSTSHVVFFRKLIVMRWFLRHSLQVIS